MSKVVVQCVGISLDGYSAGPDQTKETPLGVGGVELMEWMFPTKTFTQMQRKEGGETGVDDEFAKAAMSGKGAWILGRNMFGPVRGPWPDDSWKGWWGDEPPYHVPTYVLTHYPREPIEMKGGTTFYFVTEGIESALEQAKAAAGDKDIRIGGGAETIRQYLQAGLIDELHLVQRPVILGSGESIFDGLNMIELGYNVTRNVQGERGVHVIINKTA
jgi:dihydrofolate reductase